MSGPDELQAQESHPRRAPAWLMSLALHLAILLGAGLLFRSTGKIDLEPHRPTGIVLVRTTATQTADYYANDSTGESQLALAESSAAAGVFDSSPPVGGITLPMQPAPSASTDGLLVVRPKSGGRVGTPKLSGLTAADVAAIVAEDRAQAKGREPSGPTAKLSLFGSADTEGRSFVFLIDCSQSMGHDGLGAISAAARELSTSIGRLGPEQTFQVIAYNQKPVSLGSRELLAATPENKRRLIDFVQGAVAAGATDHEMGVFAALRFKPDVIFLLSDGGDPVLKPSQLRSIRDAAGSRTSIHCLHFGSGPLGDEENFLVRLAEQNRGSYVYIDVRKWK